MASTCMKRITRERERFPKDSQEFFVNWNDADLRKFDAYIVGPTDSLYRYKLVKLKFQLPDNYPLKPPKVTFVQHTGERIHPNLYVEGKVCLSILGTWPGPGWSTGMTIESVLITIRSLLDKQPYLHEPGQQNNEAFNAYVRYNTWRWLLLDYLDREKDSPALAFLQNHLRQSGAAMIAELEAAKAAHRYNIYMASPYALYSRNLVFDYNKLLSDLKARIKALPEAPAGPPAMEDSKLKRKLPFEPESSNTPALSLPTKKPKPTTAPDPLSKKSPPTMEVIDLTDE